MSHRNWQSLKNYKDIKFEFFEGIAKITINRPQVYNAFRPETNFEMLEALAICRVATLEVKFRGSRRQYSFGYTENDSIFAWSCSELR